MKRQKIFSLAVALALIPLSGWSATSVTAVTTDVSPPYPTPPQPQASLPPMDATKQLSHQAQEVVKLVSSGVPNDVVKAFINSSPTPFNLSSDNIIYLQGTGVSSALITDMLTHDSNLRQMASAYMPPGAIPGNQLPPTSYPTESAMTQTEQPAYVSTDTGAEVVPPDTDTYSSLAPYGNWSDIPGYGWGWSPYSWGGWGGWPWPTLGWGFWWGVPGFGWCWFPNNCFNNFHNHFHNNNFHNGFHNGNFAVHSGQNGFVAHGNNGFVAHSFNTGHTVVGHSANGHTFVAHSNNGFHGNSVSVHSFGGMGSFHGGSMGSFHSGGMGGMGSFHGGGGMGMGGMHGGGGGGHGGGGGGHR